jgi:hypothetical protein
VTSAVRPSRAATRAEVRCRIPHASAMVVFSGVGPGRAEISLSTSAHSAAAAMGQQGSVVASAGADLEDSVAVVGVECGQHGGHETGR